LYSNSQPAKTPFSRTPYLLSTPSQTTSTIDTHIVGLLEVPDQTCPALELLLTHFTLELGWVGLVAANVMVLHSVHCRTLEHTLLHQSI